MASVAPANRGQITPSPKRTIVQQLKAIDPSLKKHDDGSVWEAVRAEFPEHDDAKIVSAMQAELAGMGSPGAVTTLPEEVVKPAAKKHGLAALADFVVKPIQEQFHSLTETLPQGIVRSFQGEEALREATTAPPKFAGPSDIISEPERRLRAEEARTELGKGVAQAVGGAAPILGAAVGGLVAPALPVATGPILRSALATGSDLGTYNFLTDVAGGAPVHQAVRDAASGFVAGSALGGTGRFILNRVNGWLAKRAATTLKDAMPGSTPDASAFTPSLSTDVQGLLLRHRPVIQQFAAGQIGAEEAASLISQRLGLTRIDPATNAAVVRSLENARPELVAAMERLVPREAKLAKNAFDELHNFSPQETEQLALELADPRTAARPVQEELPFESYTQVGPNRGEQLSLPFPAHEPNTAGEGGQLELPLGSRFQTGAPVQEMRPPLSPFVQNLAKARPDLMRAFVAGQMGAGEVIERDLADMGGGIIPEDATLQMMIGELESARPGLEQMDLSAAPPVQQLSYAPSGNRIEPTASGKMYEPRGIEEAPLPKAPTKKAASKPKRAPAAPERAVSTAKGKPALDRNGNRLTIVNEMGSRVRVVDQEGRVRIMDRGDVFFGPPPKTSAIERAVLASKETASLEEKRARVLEKRRQLAKRKAKKGAE